MYAIELTGLRKTLGAFELGPLDLRVPKGGVVALLGRNGVGKTTTLDIVMGLLRQTSGTAKILGMEHPSQAVEIKARTAYVNPDLNYSSWKFVARAIYFLLGFHRDIDLDEVNRLLAAFALDHYSALATHSFGQRMKFLLVTALARDADLLLLDEPTVGLDIDAKRVLADEIGRLRQREDRTILLSTHDVPFVERLADTVIILHKGRVLAMDRVDSLLDRFVQIDVDLAATPVLPLPNGVKRLDEAGGRGRFLIDGAIIPPTDLISRGFQIITESRLNLEDLFYALTRE